MICRNYLQLYDKKLNMELEMLKTNPHFLKDTMEGDISSKTLNLSFLVKKLKCSPSWENGELDSIILFNNLKQYYTTGRKLNAW